MNHEDLVNFRDNIANPRMKEIFSKTTIPEGTCFIDNVELSFLDGRSIGVDSHFKASGFEYTDGQALVYQFEDTDLTAGEFFDAHKDCHFISDGHLTVRDELVDMELSTVLRNLSSCGKLFHQFENLPELSILSNPMEYHKLRYLIEQGPEKHQIVDMDTDGLAVEGHYGTWHTIDHADIDGVTCFLMEHDEYGDEAACIIVDSTGLLLLEDCYDGLSEETLDQVKHELDVNDVFNDLKKQLDNRLSENAYGEPQAFVMLDNGRTIQITFEQEGLVEEERYYSGCLNRSESEGAGSANQSSSGLIANERSENSSREALRELISSLLMSNELTPVHKHSLRMQIQAAAGKTSNISLNNPPEKAQDR